LRRRKRVINHVGRVFWSLHMMSFKSPSILGKNHKNTLINFTFITRVSHLK
jgi:hypothetical protein